MTKKLTKQEFRDIKRKYMGIKTKILEKIYRECPKCGYKVKQSKNYKVLLGKTFYFLECKSCGWTKGK